MDKAEEQVKQKNGRSGIGLALTAAAVAVWLTACAGDLTPEDFDGTWRWGGPLQLFLVMESGDGSWKLVEELDQEHAHEGAEGTWWVEGRQVHFVGTDSTPDARCGGIEGIYEAAVDDDALRLTLVEDACTARANTLTRGAFTRLR